MFREQMKPVRPVEKKSLDVKAQNMLSFMNIMYSTGT